MNKSRADIVKSMAMKFKYFVDVREDLYDIDAMNLWCYDQLGAVGKSWSCDLYIVQESGPISYTSFKSGLMPVYISRVGRRYCIYGFQHQEDMVLFNMIHRVYDCV